MEKKIGEKVCIYVNNFKTSIKEWVDNNDNMDNTTKGELLEFIYDFDGLTLTKEDFAKRKRIKTHVPQYLRCRAKVANGEQCTRKFNEKSGHCYCGTHDKNRPHGIIDINNEDNIKKVEVNLQEINGILYYIDNNNNVYITGDILNNKMNPGIYAKYTCENGVYKII